MTKYQQNFYDIKNTKNYKTVGDNVQYVVINDKENKQTILQFEESTDTHDWIENLTFIPWFLNLDGHLVLTTLGYAHAYKSTKNIPIDEFICFLLNTPKSYKVIIRGWSFGSAMTKIAVRHYYYRKLKNKYLPEIDEELTYGDVKCWYNPFMKFFQKKYARVIHHFTYINDFVTWCVPTCFRGLEHRVGGKFSIEKIFNTIYNHNHYEEYDYSKYEN